MHAAEQRINKPKILEELVHDLNVTVELEPEGAQEDLQAKLVQLAKEYQLAALRTQVIPICPQGIFHLCLQDLSFLQIHQQLMELVVLHLYLVVVIGVAQVPDRQLKVKLHFFLHL